MNRAQIGSDILAELTITARRALNEDSVLITQRNAQPIYL